MHSLLSFWLLLPIRKATIQLFPLLIGQALPPLELVIFIKNKTFI